MQRSAGARRLRETLGRCPAGAKISPEKCLVDLRRDTRTRTQSRRLVRRKRTSWRLNWPSGANLLAHMQLKCILYVPLLCICLSLFFGRVLTTLDYTISSAFIQLTSTRIKPLLLLRNLLNNKGALFLLFFSQ